MVATTLNGVLLTGIHASRPAANAVANGTLYSCTTHSLVYQSDASSWSTWATLGSAASGSITASGYTQTTARLLGRTTASTGAIEEITVGSGLSLSAGSLSASGGGGADANHPQPLDSYSIDATYGDDFSAASLSGSWTRRNFTGGAETYQVGPKATTIRIATASRSAGDGYYRTAPGGDWTIAMKYTILSSSLAAHWGLQVVDTNGTGVGVAIYHGAPTSMLMQGVTTYTTTSGTYYEALYGSSGSPNITYLSQNQCTFVPIWLYLRKSGTDYYTAFSLDGDAWSPEGGPLAWAGTVDRVAMGMIALSGTSAATSEVIHVDWFNKIA